MVDAWAGLIHLISTREPIKGANRVRIVLQIKTKFDSNPISTRPFGHYGTIAGQNLLCKARSMSNNRLLKAVDERIMFIQ